MFDRFWSVWNIFLSFCGKELSQQPRINQLEMTYVNHIPVDEEWGDMKSLGPVFPDFHWRPEHDFLPSPESVTWRFTFRLPEQRGRLHVSLKNGIRKSDEKPVLLCELTARGMPPESDEKKHQGVV